MLDVPIIDHHDIDAATAAFHRDGFVAVSGSLTADQLGFAQRGAARVIAEETSETPLERANRGFARYSFGDQMAHPEWTMLTDLPTILPIIDRIWGSEDHQCVGGGGDYSLPGASIQCLHSDLSDFLNDPLGQTTVRDLPTPFIVVNFLMVDFTVANGAIRFVPGTQRSRTPIPAIADEPEWMRTLQLCAPAGTAVIRDVRCWHGGSANRSSMIRPMTSVGYYAPWFRGPAYGVMPRDLYEGLSARGRKLCRMLVDSTETAVVGG
ncbi:MAG: phytanoyl-CoA dioxygenase family protein [Planctomycetes bacterium]|nr:phytanoyl-CoA dioxygenase family protein [Planctomycetota bacterium]